MKIKLTRHAISRAKERFNLNEIQVRSYSVRAITEGLDVLDDPHLKPLFLRKAQNHENTSGIYYFEGMFFVYSDDYLVTIYPLSYIHEFVPEKK